MLRPVLRWAGGKPMTMTATGPTNRYVLGNSDEEHQRLIWQATRVAPFTERLFDLGLTLYGTFEEAGLRGPTMRLEMQLGKDPDIAELFVGLIRTLRPQAKQYGVDVEALSDLEALRERLQAEVAASDAVGSWPAFVSAWSRTPAA